MTNSKSSDSQVNRQQLTPPLTVTFHQIIRGRKNKNTSFGMQSHFQVSYNRLRWWEFYLSLYLVAKAMVHPLLIKQMNIWIAFFFLISHLTVGNFISVGFILWFFVSNSFQWLKFSRNYLPKIFCIGAVWVISQNVVGNRRVNPWQLTIKCCYFNVVWKIHLNHVRKYLKKNKMIWDVSWLVFFGTFLFGMLFLQTWVIIWLFWL